MVRLSFVLSRVPVIRFRKGGGGSSSASAVPPSAGAAPTAATTATQVQQAAAMSSAAISDIDLPLRYRRQPLSEEEIDHINGGGIV